MNFIKISKHIDNFFENKNGELKFTRRLVNKEYAKKIGIFMFIALTVVGNLLSEILSNIGFSKSPNYITGIFIPKLNFLPLYLVLYLVFGTLYLKIIFSIRESFKEIDDGQKGTSRFATRKEIDEQYKAIPIADSEYKGGGGVPIARGYKNLNGKDEEVMYIDDSPVNNLIIGTTRSGKGETFVVPTIDVYSRAEKKASLVVNDPKGELIAMSKDTLEELGYEVIMLNLLEPINSMSYNPLELIKQAYKKGNYSEAQLLCKTLTHSLYYKPNVKDPFWQNSAMSLVNALILAICDECIKRCEEEKITLYTVANMLSEMGGNNRPSDDGKSEINALDEYFKSLPSNSVAKSQYATSSFAGGSARGNIFSVAMSELQTYTLEETGKLTSKNSLDFESIGFYKIFKRKVIVSEKNIEVDTRKKIYTDIKNSKIKVTGLEDIVIKVNSFENEHISNKNNYKNTTEGYGQHSSLFDEINKNNKNINNNNKEIQKNKINKKLLEGVRALNVDGKDITHEISIDISNVKFDKIGEYEVEYKIPLEKPKAIFMVTPDYDKSNHILASIFVRQIYYVLAKKSSLSNTGKCDREVKFLLDEFGNMPSIEGFANIITVCLGRGIRFDMIIQSYSQLKALYGEDSQTIEANCGNQIYILTNDNDTAEKFSKLVGEKTEIVNSRSGEVFSLSKSHTESLDNRRLLKADELTKLREGETVVVRVIKRKDNNGEKIVSYPIFNRGEYYMKYRYEYLNESFDNRANIFKNVKVESLHKDVKLDDLIIDFSKSEEELKREKEDKIIKMDNDIEKILKNKISSNSKNKTDKVIKNDNNIENVNCTENEEDNKIIENNNVSNKETVDINNNKDIIIISEQQKSKVISIIGNSLSAIEKNIIKDFRTKEEVIDYLKEINKEQLINKVNLFIK